MANRPPSRDMSVVLQLGSIVVSWNAEGVSWSPDVADDMTSRTMQMLREALAEALEYGLLRDDNEFTADMGELSDTTAGEDVDG